MLITWVFIVNMALGISGAYMTHFSFAVGPFNSLAECGAAQVVFNVIPTNPGYTIGPWSKTPCYQKP
jgi:hypothetical protein